MKTINQKEDRPICAICGMPMINAIDKKTGKESEYLWKTTCEHIDKELILSKG